MTLEAYFPARILLPLHHLFFLHTSFFVLRSTSSLYVLNTFCLL